MKQSVIFLKRISLANHPIGGYEYDVKLKYRDKYGMISPWSDVGNVHIGQSAFGIMCECLDLSILSTCEEDQTTLYATALLLTGSELKERIEDWNNLTDYGVSSEYIR